MTGFLWSDESDEFFRNPKEKPNPSHKTGKPQGDTPGASSETPLSVSQLNAQVKRALDQSISAVWLIGEISNLTQSSAGHVYFSLKDSTNQISAVIWRSAMERVRVRLTDGMSVLVYGRLDVYGPRGSYQIVVQKVEEQGLGSLQAALRKLHAKLEREGLFRPERKRPLPPFPRRVGFVTSPHGAAIHDFLQVLRRRWPLTDVLIIPAKVQGEGAAQEIADGIELANSIVPALDVLVVGRGGGSAEDLWAFNEEVVVRAIVASSIPTVSAVGHEIDVSLSDLAADVRALTPSEAAELVVPSRDQITAALAQAKGRLGTLMLNRLQYLQSRFDALRRRHVFENPERMLDMSIQRLDEIEKKLADKMSASMDAKELRFKVACATLEAMSPLKILGRGYSVTSDAESGSVLKEIEQAAIGMRIRTKLADGELLSDIVSLHDAG